MLNRYVGPAAVAAHLGVVRATVSNWQLRWPGTIPAPDATVDGRPLWLESRLDEWARWYTDRHTPGHEPVVHHRALYRYALAPDAILEVEDSGNVVIQTPGRRVTVTNIREWIDQLAVARQIAGASGA